MDGFGKFHRQKLMEIQILALLIKTNVFTLSCKSNSLSKAISHQVTYGFFYDKIMKLDENST